MDTSDSEHFESADEEIDEPSKQETTSKPKSSITEQLSISSNNPSNENDRKLTHKTSTEKDLSKICEEKTNDFQNIVKQSPDKGNLRGVAVKPPIRVTCWFPDVPVKPDSEGFESANKEISEPLKRPDSQQPLTLPENKSSEEDGKITQKTNIEICDDLQNTVRQSPNEEDIRRVAVKPPLRTTCWFPGVNNVPLKLDREHQKQETEKVKSSISGQYHNPNDEKDNKLSPNMSTEKSSNEIYEEETNNSQNIEKQSSHKENIRGVAVKPPLIATCWFPGVNNVPLTNFSTTGEKIDNSENAANQHRSFNKSVDDVDNVSDNENMWKDDEDWENLSKNVDHNKENVSELNSNIQAKREEVTETNDENMWENDWDQWETVDQKSKPDADTKLEPIAETVKNEPPSTSMWGSWGSWGVTSLISTATSSVSTLTSQMTQGLSTVLESGIGVPEPEELAKLHEESRKTEGSTSVHGVEKKSLEVLTEYDSNKNAASMRSFNLEGLLTGVTQITKLVETTGNKVISGGLDTLETIGKKTMEVLQEGDPGLKKKRAFLMIDSEKPNLSHILREAKEKSQEENLNLKQNVKKVNYETLFDDHQGLVHLEALEMLSKQCDIKLSTLLASASGEALSEMQETIAQVRELCELPEDENEENVSCKDLKEKLDGHVSELNIPISFDKFMSVWEETELWLENVNLASDSHVVLHQKAIDALAQLTAFAVEQFHKSGELLLIKEHRSTADEADSLSQITTVLMSFMGYVASKFCSKMSEIDNKDNVNELITNIYFEAANSSSYIKDAFELLTPVIQVGAM